MSENQETQEDILANFQSITGIDDVAESIFYLEESEWDLLSAVNRVLPQDHVEQDAPYNAESLNNLNIAGTSSNENRMPASPNALLHRNIFGSESPSAINASDDSNLQNMNDEGMEEDGHDHQTNGGNSAAHGSATNTPKEIKFNIHHKYTTHNVNISDRSTIGDLKTKIFEVTGIPVCRQSWCGWVQSSENYDNRTELHTMNLSSENELIVTDIKDLRAEDIGVADDDETVDRLSRTFTLNILNEKSGSSLRLNFPGTQTILDIKNDVYSITNIAVRHQQWLGWPSTTTDNTALAMTGIPLEHDLILGSTERNTATVSNPIRAFGSQTQAETSSSTSNTRTIIASATAPPPPSLPITTNNINELIEVDSDSSVDEFEDASDFNGDDDIFNTPSTNRRIKNLIPDGTDNERLGCTQFIENYKERYGEPYPHFYEGSLEEALREACHKPAKDRKLLAIYLHHDKSVLTNVFCDRLMKCDTIMQTIEHNFILYGWDLTYESNKNLFLSSLSACAGATALISVRNMPVNRLPAILVIGKSRSVCEVLSVIYGNVGVDELLNKLMDTIKFYSDQREVEVREEDERAARELVKMEQDAAYHESLEADRRKEEEKMQKERAIAFERKRLESERQEIEMIREMNRQEAEKCVPAEPAEDATGITKIRIRKPTGEFMERRFLAGNPLDLLLKFIASKGFPIDEYKVISSWPRRDLTTLEKGDTLQELKLCPQETVILEER